MVYYTFGVLYIRSKVFDQLTANSNQLLCTGASPQIFEWGVESSEGGQPTPKYPKIGKNTGFWPLHPRIWGVHRPGFQKCGGQDPPPPDPPVGDAPDYATVQIKKRVDHRPIERNSGRRRVTQNH